MCWSSLWCVCVCVCVCVCMCVCVCVCGTQIRHTQHVPVPATAADRYTQLRHTRRHTLRHTHRHTPRHTLQHTQTHTHTTHQAPEQSARVDGRTHIRPHISTHTRPHIRTHIRTHIRPHIRTPGSRVRVHAQTDGGSSHLPRWQQYLPHHRFSSLGLRRPTTCVKRDLLQGQKRPTRCGLLRACQRLQEKI